MLFKLIRYFTICVCVSFILRKRRMQLGLKQMLPLERYRDKVVQNAFSGVRRLTAGQSLNLTK